MMEEELLLGRPVSSLQYMLGELSYVYDQLPFVAVDGVFGEETLEAVMVFQREFSQPVTGRVDQRTWDAVVCRYRELERQRAKPLPLRGFPAGAVRIEPGDRDDTMALVQVLFQNLSGVVDEILPDEGEGYHGARSQHNVRWLQRVSGLEQTGIMDRFAWNMLVRLYELFLIRRREVERVFPAE